MNMNRPRRTRQVQSQDAPQMPERESHPLDKELPRYLELRVVGTSFRIRAPINEFIVLGRSENRLSKASQPDVDLTPYGAVQLGVSRRHAIINVQTDRVMIKDANSTNGTYLNDFALAPTHAYRLRHGDEIRLGQHSLQVMFIGIPATEGDGTTIRL